MNKGLGEAMLYVTNRVLFVGFLGWMAGMRGAIQVLDHLPENIELNFSGNLAAVTVFGAAFAGNVVAGGVAYTLERMYGLGRTVRELRRDDLIAPGLKEKSPAP